MPPAVSKALFYTLAAGPLPRNTIEVVGPETLTGEDLARIWSEANGKAVSYAGDDLDAFEGMMGRFATGTQARDMRMMFRAFHKYGMAPEPVTHSILAGSSRRFRTRDS